MTFDARETSVESGRPFRLYEFRLGVLAWRYTDADRLFTFATEDYLPIAISDDGVRQSGEVQTDALTVTVPFDLPVVKLFRAAPPATEIEVTIRELHVDEAESRIAYIGYVQSMKRPGPERAAFVCQDLNASMDRMGLRLGWERGCPHTIYDESCGVSRALHQVSGIVDSKTALTLTVGAFAALDGKLARGDLEFSIGGGEVDRRGIEEHVGPTVRLIGGTDGIELGVTVTAVKGCKNIAGYCNSEFSNLPNYGGFPHLQGENPFGGKQLW
jgi:uncharacterized phage protein (TIGR02218 family)